MRSGLPIRCPPPTETPLPPMRTIHSINCRRTCRQSASGLTCASGNGQIPPSHSGFASLLAQGIPEGVCRDWIPPRVLHSASPLWPWYRSDPIASDAELRSHDGAAARLDFLSTNTMHITATGSGHEIHLYQPDAVVQATESSLSAVRKSTPLSHP